MINGYYGSCERDLHRLLPGRLSTDVRQAFLTVVAQFFAR